MKFFSLILLSLLFIRCGSGENQESNDQENSPEENYVPLPYLGLHETEIKLEQGKEVTDTIYHVIEPYFLLAHDSSEFTNERVKGKVHVANFFFTSCPSICPAMMEQMKRFNENTSDIKELIILSHTIDPRRDSIPKLVQYRTDKGITDENWFFLYGEREYVHELAQLSYVINAGVDSLADGGFMHSEHFILIDREGHVRGLYEGTDNEQVDLLEKDLRNLLKYEYGEE